LAAPALWICALLALIASSVLGVALPAEQAAAQAIGGRNLKDTSQGGGVVVLTWSSGTGQTGYQLKRITASGTVLLTTLPATATTFTDNLGGGVQVACYMLEILGTGNAVVGTSPILCNIVNLAAGTVRPRNISITGDSGIVTIDWDDPSTAGTIAYLVVPLGENPLPVLPATVSVAVHAPSGPTCYIVLALIPDSSQSPFLVGGFSDIKCWVGPATGQIVPATPTVTRTATGTATSLTATTTVTGTSTAPTTTPTTSTTPTPTQTLTPIDLTILKTDQPDPVNPGQTITYTITVRNLGQTGSDQVTVLDSLPAGLTFGSAAGAVGTNFVCNETSPPGTVVCTGGVVPGNGIAEITLVAIVDNPCVVVSPVFNRVEVDPSKTIAEGNEFNNTAEQATVINGCVQATPTATQTRTPTVTRTATGTATPTATPAVDLVISKFDQPDPVSLPGAPAQASLQYTISVQNTGTVGASNITVRDDLPAGEGTDYFFGTASGDNGFVCDFNFATPPVVTCTGGNIGAGGGATISIVLNFLACPATFYTNTATVDPANTIAEFNEGNNLIQQTTGCAGSGTVVPTTTPVVSPTATATVTPTRTPTAVPTAGFGFVKLDAPDPVIHQGILTFTLQLTNTSGATISGVALSDILPNQVTFGSFGAIGGGFLCEFVPTNGPEGGLVSCANGTLTTGVPITIEINVVVTSCISPIVNNAQILTPNVQNNTATSSTTVTAIGGGVCPSS
jgi:uncharacterized repeat protein (TIGR01451 family)